MRLGCVLALFVVAGCGRSFYDEIRSGQDSGLAEDAGMSDASTPLASPCASTSAWACLDMENQADIDAWRLSADPGNLVERDTTRAKSGTASLRIVISGAPPTSAKLILDDVVPPGVTEIYGRQHIFMPASNSFERGSLFTVVHNIMPFPGVVLQMLNGNATLVSTQGTGRLVEGESIPRERWTCMELRIDLGAPGAASVSFDGLELAELNGDTEGQPYVDAHVGMQLLSGPGPVEFWVDDFEVGSAPLPCP